MPSYKVPAIGQDHKSTCWDACAKMMCGWKYASDTTAHSAAMTRIKTFRTGHNGQPGWGDRGMGAAELKTYYGMFGMNVLAKPKLINLHHALKWTPVILGQVQNGAGHVTVFTGFDGRYYESLDPRDVDMSQPGYVAGKRRELPSEVGKRLGEGMYYW